MQRVGDRAERADRLAGRRQRRVEEVVRPVTEEVACDRRADERQQEQQDDRDAAADRDLVALEAPPDLLPVATRLDLELAELDAGLERDGTCEPGLAPEDFVFGLAHGRLSVPARSGLRDRSERSGSLSGD